MPRCLRRFAKKAVVAGFVSAALFGAVHPLARFARADEPVDVEDANSIRLLGSRFFLASLFQEDGAPPVVAEQLVAPRQPVQSRFVGPAFYESPFAEDLTADLVSGGSSQSTGGGEVFVGGGKDIIAAISESPNIQTVASQQRSQASFDPRVRGFHIGQVYAQSNGEYFMPVRNDLDSMLSKLDPSLIENIEVIPGPYSARLGPGFAFIDVTTVDTPRYCDGYETHGRTGFTTRTNGGQVYGYQTIMGGSSDYGFIVNYANRTGADYEAGNGSRTPASFHSQNFLGQFGFDLSPDSKIEFRYNRMDLTNAEFALQFFDTDYLVTDSISTTYTAYDWETNSRTRMDGWFNRTRFAGDTAGAGKRPFPGNPDYHVIDRVEEALSNTQLAGAFGFGNVRFNGQTDGDLISAGARLMRTYGDDGDNQLRVGADVRYLQQHTAERYQILSLNPGPPPGPPTPLLEFGTNQPRSTMTDPGLFTEVVLPSDSFYTTKFGGRVDIVTTDAQAWGDFPDGLRTGTAIGGAPANFPRKDSLYSLYLTEDLQLTDEWTAQASVAHGQRTPSLTERYADGVFLAMMQSGFTRVIGRPDLPRERNFQADLSLKGDFDYWHVRATGFHAWVYDYVTYSSVAVSDPTGALIVFANNTHLATLAGYELYGDLDLSPGISVFATAQWVRGRDQTLDQPLPGIYPLSGRMGLRVVDPYEENRWGTEFGARMVDAQQQLGTIRVVGSNNLRTVETLTPGFTTLYVRGYYNVTPSFNIVAGVDNLLDRNYFEHLNLRLRPDGAFPGVQVLSPGITPYFAVEWKY